MENKQIDILNVSELYNDPRLINAVQQWDLFEFLDDFNVSYSMDGKNIGNNYIGVNPCPSCNDTRNHFAVHKERKYGTCFICKFYAGPLKLISYFGHMNIVDAFNYLINDIEENKDIEQRVKEILYGSDTPINVSIYAPTKKDYIPTSKIITFKDLKNNKTLNKFFKDRKLHIWDVKRYGLRILKNEILWTIYLRGKPVSYQKRSLINKRYYIPSNLPNYIYAEDHIISNKPLILVEGFLDYTRINNFIRCYYPNEISVTTGMVKSISKKQINRIIDCKPSKLIVMYDNDSWFDYWRVRNEIPFDVDFVILPKGKDPNELTWNELKTIFRKEIL